MTLGRNREDELRPRPVTLVAGSLLLVAVLPSVAAIWWVPGFVTQDGPAHVYNAHILLESLRLGDESPFADAFEANWRPLPNLGGHLTLMGMLAVLPARAADRAMTTLSLVGFAAAILWLRVRVAGPSGLPTAAMLAALIAINMPWLMGFSNFLLGATLTLLTWGVWWNWRNQLDLRRMAMVGGLLVIGYLGHLVSLGLTAGGLMVLAALASGGRDDRLRRLLRTALACLPLVPLALLYSRLTAEGGAFEPTWEQSGPFWSPLVWLKRVSWVDPIALGRRDLVPLGIGPDGRGALIISSSLWLGVGLAVVIGGSLRRWATASGPSVSGDRGAWAGLSGLLLLGAMLGPDGFGEDHGYFLTQRVALIGLACLVPALDLESRRPWGWWGTAAIALALGLQSAFVWDYARQADPKAGAILRAGSEVGRGQRVGTLLIDIRGRYRANPILHADCLLGVGTGNVLWSNYETRHYYFPVQVRSGVDAPSALAFEQVAILDDPADADLRARLWRKLLDDHGEAIDVILVWGTDPRLEAITADWARGGPVVRSGSVLVFHRSERRAEQQSAERSGAAVASSPHGRGT